MTYENYEEARNELQVWFDGGVVEATGSTKIKVPSYDPFSGEYPLADIKARLYQYQRNAFASGLNYGMSYMEQQCTLQASFEGAILEVFPRAVDIPSYQTRMGQALYVMDEGEFSALKLEANSAGRDYAEEAKSVLIHN